MLPRPILAGVTGGAAATKRYFGRLAVTAQAMKPCGSRSEWESATRAGSGCTNIPARAFQTKSDTAPFSTISEIKSIDPSAAERTFSTGDHSRAIKEWTTQVATIVESQPELDVWLVESSIVSILLHHSGNGSLFDIDELGNVRRYMSMDVSRNVPRSVNAEERAILAVVCNNNIGAPSLDEHAEDNATRAILSISLGNDEALAKYLEDAEGILEKDAIAVKKLALVAKYFVAITKSNVL
jgi:hypothetical protein